MLASIILAAQQSGQAAESTRSEYLKLILPLIPGLLSGLAVLFNKMGRAAHRQEAKAMLELLTMKYQLAALRRQSHLDELSDVKLTEEEQRFLAAEVSEAGLSEAGRIRRTLVYRYVQSHPRSGGVLASLVSILSVIYISMVVLGVPLFFVSGGATPRSLPNSIAWSILYFLAAFALLAGSVRVHRAKQLAIADIHHQTK
jgi:hypothetical protein